MPALHMYGGHVLNVRWWLTNGFYRAVSQRKLGAAEAFLDMWHADTYTLQRTSSMRTAYPRIGFVVDHNCQGRSRRRSFIGQDRRRAGHRRPRPTIVPIVRHDKLVGRLRAHHCGNDLVRVGGGAARAVSS